MKYELAGQTFTSLERVRLHCRSVLARYTPGDNLSVDDASFAHDLLNRHQAADTKRGVGVKRYMTMRSSYGETIFGLQRVDGTFEHFSYNRCLYKLAPRTHLIAALRHEVDDQVYGFLKRRLARLGQPYIEGQWHVHHVTPFDQLWRDWLKARNYTESDIGLIDRPNNEGYMLADREQAREWLSYHERHAILQEMPISDHKQVHAGGVMPEKLAGVLDRLRAKHAPETIAPSSDEGLAVVRRQIADAGLTLSASNDVPPKLLARPASKMTDELRTLITAHKSDLLLDILFPPVDDAAAMNLFHTLSEGADMFSRTPDAAYDPFGAS